MISASIFNCNRVKAGGSGVIAPKPVKIKVSQFMEKDVEGVSHWFDITQGKWIQRLIARDGTEQRVYVVTVEPEMEDAVHDRWPRVLAG